MFHVSRCLQFSLRGLHVIACENAVLCVPCHAFLFISRKKERGGEETRARGVLFSKPKGTKQNKRCVLSVRGGRGVEVPSRSCRGPHPSPPALPPALPRHMEHTCQAPLSAPPNLESSCYACQNHAFQNCSFVSYYFSETLPKHVSSRLRPLANIRHLFFPTANNVKSYIAFTWKETV